MTNPPYTRFDNSSPTLGDCQAMNTILLAALSLLLLALTTQQGYGDEAIIPYFVSATDPDKESVVRAVFPNHKDMAQCATPILTITVYNDDGERMEPIEVPLSFCDPPPDGTLFNGALTFNSHDLEYGNPDKLIPNGIAGSTMGDWWLRLESDSNFVVQSFVRTSDGLLTPMHDSLPIEQQTAHMFNPAANTAQRSFLRIINTSDTYAAQFSIVGCSDKDIYRECQPALKGFRTYESNMGMGDMTLQPGQALMLPAQDLETSEYWSTYTGGKRQVAVRKSRTNKANHQLIVQNLMFTPTGHLTNMSTHLGWDTDNLRRDDLYPPKLPRLPRPLSDDHFNIDLQFDSDVSEQIRTLVRQAARRWENVIVEGRSAGYVGTSSGQCDNENGFHGNIDDILIFVSIESQDDGEVLARGGHCEIDGNARLPRTGRVKFYPIAVDRLEGRRESVFGYDEAAFFENLAVHEIGHALGFSRTMFEHAGMLETKPSRFTGGWAHNQLQLLKMKDGPLAGVYETYTSHLEGFGVPLAEDRSHWVTGNLEIMGQGVTDGSSISQMDISALGDLGYRVDITRYESGLRRVSTSVQTTILVDDILD